MTNPFGMHRGEDIYLAMRRRGTQLEGRWVVINCERSSPSGPFAFVTGSTLEQALDIYGVMYGHAVWFARELEPWPINLHES